MNGNRRFTKELRKRFDEVYDSCIVGAGFFETDEYYRNEKERYWRSLEFICRQDIPWPANMLEIGGGQMAILCKKLFNDVCTVADISDRFVFPIRKSDIRFFEYNLLNDVPDERQQQFDVVVLLEVIEHIPVPAYVVFRRLKSFLTPAGILFLTTPNLFRVRNLIRMFLGVEFLDHFMLPEPGHGLGHQLEYSAKHLKWQLEHAEMEIMILEHDNLGHVGHSLKARIGRALSTPLQMRPIWRDALVVVARKASCDRHQVSS